MTADSLQRTGAAAAKRRSWFGPLNPPIDKWEGRRVWLVGASSGIGEALARGLLLRGASVVVSARSAQALAALADEHPGTDAQGRARVQAVPLDATDETRVAEAADAAFAAGRIDLMIYCAGYYRPQRATDFDLADMLKHAEVNYAGVLKVLDQVLPRFIAQRSGHLSMISSVAGYHGLPQSLAYGPTKAALINLCETLYLDLRPQGIGVSVINPGFVKTPLTEKNDFPMPAMIEPSEAAEAILGGWADGAFEIHFPKRFTLAVKAMGLLPYRLYFAAVHRLTGL